MSFSANRNNLLYEILYNYPHLWHVIAHFGKDYFHASIYYEAVTKFWVSVCKSNLCTRSWSNKDVKSFEIWYRDTGKSFREDLETIFLKIDLVFFKLIKKKYFSSDFKAKYSFILRFFTSLLSTWGLHLVNSG